MRPSPARLLVALLVTSTIVAGLAPRASAQVSYTISTFAGVGGAGHSGDGGPATSAHVAMPYHLSQDKSGNTFVAECSGSVIRKIDANGIITTVAGDATIGYSGDGGPAGSAKLNCPTDVDVDDSGNLYIVDSQNFVIRKVDVNGIISTIAGTGVAGYSGDGGPAASAQFSSWVSGLFRSPSGELYIADANNDRIRKIDVNGIITTIPGGGAGGGYKNDVVVAPSGDVYCACEHRIRKISTGGVATTLAGSGVGGYGGDGGPAASALVRDVDGIALDGLGNIYFADSGNRIVRRIDPGGTIVALAGNGTTGDSGDGGPALAAQFALPAGVAVTASGDLLISDWDAHRIRRVAGIAPASGSTTLGTTVEPSLTFTVSGRSSACNGATPTPGASSSATSVALGRIGEFASGIANQDLTATTNAANGWVVLLHSTSSLNDGAGHALAEVPTPDGQPVAFPTGGPGYWGYTMEWYSAFGWTNYWSNVRTTQDDVLQGFGPGTYGGCIGYRAQAGAVTPAGNYSTTVVYTVVPRY